MAHQRLVRLARHGPLEFGARITRRPARQRCGTAVAFKAILWASAADLAAAAPNFDSAAAGRRSRPRALRRRSSSSSSPPSVSAFVTDDESTKSWPTAVLPAVYRRYVEGRAERRPSRKGQGLLHAVDVGARRVALQDFNFKIRGRLAVRREYFRDPRRPRRARTRRRHGGARCPALSRLGQPPPPRRRARPMLGAGRSSGCNLAANHAQSRAVIGREGERPFRGPPASAW